MSIFNSIMNKVFHHDSATAPQAAAPAAAAPDASVGAGTSIPGPTAAPNVDVGAVLAEMASMKNGGGNYQSSIVDLLKLLDIDSGLAARKQLADELNVHVGTAGSAEENVALHKAVMDQLSQNGGIVPDSLRN